ncbi:MAG: undecaprenyldiphospho-muramoylpentapeptide beta-N-acetylglucosaminyltransferase [Terracidiphilus sp.]|jgi:UDP-N-acetylglucosamine--N-acetylmuramyl-(pentapeptide) pyrophosphoryl-undecaprenol N-acetylglucosamine transferase
MNSKLRIVIAGGGTGGHIIPALAVARALVERHSAEVLLVGTARGLESRLVPEAGFPLRLIDVGPLKSVSLATRLRTLVRLPASIFECKRILREFQPGAVLGVGGYASGPAMLAALWLKVPTMVYEPNAMPGLANRIVGKRVARAAINFPAAARWFRNAEVTGVPVRPEFFSLPAPQGPLHLLIFGGSLGARILNTHLPTLMPALLGAVPGLTVLHQSGERHAAVTLDAYTATGADPARWQVRPFLSDMAAEFARAHLILSRSGATTVAEEAAAGKPALLVPFAAATDEHQRRNAEAMVQAGAAVMLEEKEFEIPDRLLTALIGLLNDPARLAAMSAAARTQAHPGAAERIADRLGELAKKAAS